MVASGAGTPEVATVPISDYAVVGNCHTAALVSRSGDVDWLCMPRFDSDSVFAAILDPVRGGRLRTRPLGVCRSHRWYVPGTNILRTCFETDVGEVFVTDFMPVDDDTSSPGSPSRSPTLCRLIECVRGSAQIDIDCTLRPDFARQHPRHEAAEDGWIVQSGRQSVRVCSSVALALCESRGSLEALIRLHAGESAWLVVEDRSIRPEPLDLAEVRRMLKVTIGWWRDWCAQLRYTGAHREAVERSSLALKLLCHAPSGAMVAAPTTSLPEVPGGAANWDYRFCWVRDASMAMRAMLRFGFSNEASAFAGWLASVTVRSSPRLNVLYDVDGRQELPERELEHLCGYANSRPVRIGNAASKQLQLDSFGSLVDAIYAIFDEGGELTRQTTDMLLGVADQACKSWRLLDNGIWESRLGLRHHTLSKAMCWVALRRALELHDRAGVEVPADRYRHQMSLIRATIDAHAVADAGHYTVDFDSDEVDPSLLLLAIYGYEPADSDRMLRTLREIDRRLGPAPHLKRHLAAEKGSTDAEGAFVIAGFWAVEVLALAGHIDEASNRFDALLRCCNDVGLLAEEIDRDSGRHWGNFPQALSHIGLLNAAKCLARARGDEAMETSHDPRSARAVV